jgi:heat shock protein HslJ
MIAFRPETSGYYVGAVGKPATRTPFTHVTPPKSVRRTHLGIVVFATVLVGGLAMGQTTQLLGSQWRPVRIGPTSIPSDTRAFIRFETEGRLLGHGGCNRFFGTYKASDAGISFDRLGSTRMACPKPVMDTERALFDTLEQARSFVRSGTELRLFDANGNEFALLIQSDRE